MFRRVLFSAVAVVAGFSVAAYAAPKDEVTDAAKKLGEAKSYSWKSDVQSQGGGGGGGGRGRFGGPTEGKIEKDGFAHLSMQRGDNTIEAVLKGDKGAVKTQDGWQSLEEMRAQLASGGGQGGQGGQGRGGFMAMQLRNFKAPAAEAQELASKTKELTKSGDAFTGELTEEAAKELMSFRRGRAGQDAQDGGGPTVSDAKGTVKFWVKDGALAKYEYQVQGKMEFNGNTRDIDRTTTVEIKDVDSTKVEVPEEAKSKLS